MAQVLVAAVVLRTAARALRACAAAHPCRRLQSPHQLPHPPQIPTCVSDIVGDTTAASAAARSSSVALRARATNAAAARHAAVAYRVARGSHGRHKPWRHFFFPLVGYVCIVAAHRQGE